MILQSLNASFIDCLIKGKKLSHLLNLDHPDQQIRSLVNSVKARKKVDFDNLPKDTNILFAKSDNQIHGYLTYKREKSKLIVNDVFSYADSRGQGVGTQLITKLKNKLKNSSLKSIEVDLVPGNADRLPFFLKNGFSVVEDLSLIHI